MLLRRELGFGAKGARRGRVDVDPVIQSDPFGEKSSLIARGCHIELEEATLFWGLNKLPDDRLRVRIELKRESLEGDGGIESSGVVRARDVFEFDVSPEDILGLEGV